MKTTTLKKILILILALTSFNGIAQHELYYAKKINEYKTDIIKSDLKDIDSLRKFVENPFKIDSYHTDTIKKQFDYFILNDKNAKNRSEESPAGILGGLTSAVSPSISESEIILAITDVIVDRAKEELAVAYLDKMVVLFDSSTVVYFKCGKSRLKMKDLFPNLYILIKNSRDNMNMQLGNTFKVAIEEDIKNMYDNINRHMLPNCVKDSLQYTIANTLYISLKELSRQSKPEQMFSAVRKGIENELTNDAEHLVNILGGVSESLINKENGEWYSGSELNLKENEQPYYISLVFGNEKNQRTYNKYVKGLTDPETYAKVEADIKKILYRLMRIANHFENVQKQNQVSYSVNNTDPGLDNFLSMYGDQVSTASEKSTINLTNKIQVNYNLVLDEIVALIQDLQSSEIFNINETTATDAIETAKNILTFYKAIKDKNYGLATISVLQILDLYINDEDIPKELVKYLTLASDIAQAKNAEDAKNIFEAAILPVGSYKIKRSTHFSSSISSYLGFTGGFEWLDDDNIDKAFSFYYGPFLPIGVDLTWSRGDEDHMKPSYSLYFSLLDLGAVAGYRLQNNNDTIAQTVPDVKFKNIISPGIFFIYGFKKSPLTIGAGLQYSPALREIYNDQDIKINTATAIRGTVFLTVDIPLLNLSIKGQDDYASHMLKLNKTGNKKKTRLEKKKRKIEHKIKEIK